MLSVHPDTLITIVGGDGLAERHPVKEVEGSRLVFDWWGNVHEITVTRQEAQEAVYMVGSASGEALFVGENHNILVREVGSPYWNRVPVSSITEMKLVRLPTRKIGPVPMTVFDAFDVDDRGAFLAPERASDMAKLINNTTFYGVTASREKAELRINVEKNRPSCFVTKLVMGAFQQDLEKSLAGLVAGGIIVPARFDTVFLDKTEATGVIFEGASVYQDIPLVPPKKINKQTDVYHITVKDEAVAVELNYFQS